MAERPILEYPDPRLREPASRVETFDASVGKVIDDLLDTLYASDAIGLCAPQLGVQKQILVMDLSEGRDTPQVFVNPEIIGVAAWGLVEEKCLSVPGVVANVWRATQIGVEAQDRAGESFKRNLQNMDAVVLQHERDHFDGKLLVDRLWFWKRWRLDADMKRRAATASA